MNIFNSILQKLGIQKSAAAPVKPAVSTPPAAPTPSANIGAPAPNPAAAQGAEATAVAKPVSVEVKPAPVAIQPAVEVESASPSLATDSAGVSHGTVPMVDVVSMLEDLGKSHPGADWKVSIADLLMMLGFEHSYEYRKELATELGCPADQMSDSARMNVWLHKTVLQKIAENGGNIPDSLLS